MWSSKPPASSARAAESLTSCEECEENRKNEEGHTEERIGSGARCSELREDPLNRRP